MMKLMKTVIRLYFKFLEMKVRTGSKISRQKTSSDDDSKRQKTSANVFDYYFGHFITQNHKQIKNHYQIMRMVSE